jgi:hypothetical protein
LKIKCVNILNLSLRESLPQIAEEKEEDEDEKTDEAEERPTEGTSR